MKYTQYINHKYKQYIQSQLLLDVVIAVRTIDILMSWTSLAFGLFYILIVLILKTIVYIKFKDYIAEHKAGVKHEQLEQEFIKVLESDPEFNTITPDNVKIYISYHMDSHEEFESLYLLYFSYRGGTVLTCRGQWLSSYLLEI